MENTLQEALAKVFIGSASPGSESDDGSDGGGSSASPEGALDQALEEAAAAFGAGEEALSKGDFAAYLSNKLNCSIPK